jgi:hypothetical protein
MGFSIPQSEAGIQLDAAEAKKGTGTNVNRNILNLKGGSSEELPPACPTEKLLMKNPAHVIGNPGSACRTSGRTETNYRSTPDMQQVLEIWAGTLFFSQHLA